MTTRSITQHSSLFHRQPPRRSRVGATAAPQCAPLSSTTSSACAEVWSPAFSVLGSACATTRVRTVTLQLDVKYEPPPRSLSSHRFCRRLRPFPARHRGRLRRRLCYFCRLWSCRVLYRYPCTSLHIAPARYRSLPWLEFCRLRSSPIVLEFMEMPEKYATGLC